MAPDAASGFASRFSGMFDPAVSAGRGVVFVQGIWRSGTSWVGQMIDSDPRIYVCPHELQAYMRLTQVTQFGESLAANAFLETRHAEARKTAFLAMLLHLQQSEKPRASRLGERSPGADVWRLKKDFPEAKFVILLRDGRDICVSSAFLAAATRADLHSIDPQSGRVAPPHVIASALNYSTYVPDYLSLKAAYPDDVLLVRYEDLHRNTVAEMTRVFAFLDLAPDPIAIEQMCRRHALSQKHASTTNPADAGFWVRKGAVGDWRHHLDESSVYTFETLAGADLVSVGYPLASAARPVPPKRLATGMPGWAALHAARAAIEGICRESTLADTESAWPVLRQIARQLEDVELATLGLRPEFETALKEALARRRPPEGTL